MTRWKRKNNRQGHKVDYKQAKPEMDDSTKPTKPIESRLEVIKHRLDVVRPARNIGGETIYWDAIKGHNHKLSPSNPFATKANRKRKTFKRFSDK